MRRCPCKRGNAGEGRRKDIWVVLPTGVTRKGVPYFWLTQKRKTSMPIKIDTSGFDKLKRNLEALQGTHQVKLGELFPPEFIQSHSKCSDLDGLFKAAGYDIQSIEDIEAIDDEQWDSFIKENTDFDDWQEMRSRAVADYTRKRLKA
jgi:hypothetical protein